MSSDVDSVLPGFCPSCRDILPLLKETGGVKCYTCHSEWGPNVFGDMKVDFVIHFNNIDSYIKKPAEENKEEGPVVERKCNKCSNNKMTYAAIQLRSADEGQTVFYTCTKCGFKETENS